MKPNPINLNHKFADRDLGRLFILLTKLKDLYELYYNPHEKIDPKTLLALAGAFHQKHNLHNMVQVCLGLPFLFDDTIISNDGWIEAGVQGIDELLDLIKLAYPEVIPNIRG